MSKIKRTFLFLSSYVSKFIFILLVSKKNSIKLEKKTIFIFNRVRIKGNKNQVIQRNKSMFFRSKIFIRGKGNILEICSESKIKNCEINIEGDNCHIIIGENVKANQLIVIMQDKSNKLSIGKHTSINGHTEIYIKEGTEVIIGQDCMLSRDIIIRTNDAHSIIDKYGIRTNISKSIHIGDHVWISQSVMIMKGVHVCENSIIGGGTLLTKSQLISNAIIAGNPGRVVKHEVNWIRELI